MVLCDRLLAVWCETLDDIAVLRRDGQNQAVDFVQVKAQGADSFWSVAELCRREEARPGTSILEKSLANDRCRERCDFTIVTTRDLRSELRPLSLTPTEPSRAAGIAVLAPELAERLSGYASPNGHDAAWWARRTRWRVLHSSAAARDYNRVLLSKIAEANGSILLETVYELLLQRIIIASAKDKNAERNAGKFERDELKQWLGDRINDTYRGGQRAGGPQLRQKLESAGLDAVAISTATELRRSYFSRALQPSYLDLDNIRAWEDKVRGRLNRLRASLDTGAITESGVDFHSRALSELAGLRIEFEGDDPPPDEILQGCMYHITALCQHRFVRAEI